MTGTVFDIQKFALYDGPGIRTVIFLKGCPLQCTWCCNPESRDPNPQLAFRADKCTHCLACVEACPNQAHFASSGLHAVDFSKCSLAQQCVSVCGYDALRIVGKEMDADSVLKEVMKDKSYYDKSGGGLTLSGGEPLLQFDFALELLTLAKAKGLHTCIETSGHVSPENMARIAPLVDLFLFDYKITGRDDHKRHTGVFPEKIMTNLEYLAANGSQIVLRCPIIPGINDTPEHFTAISELSQRYDSIISVEVMAYHDMGRDKAAQVGLAWNLAVKTVAESLAETWVEQLDEMGCRNVKRG